MSTVPTISMHRIEAHARKLSRSPDLKRLVLGGDTQRFEAALLVQLREQFNDHPECGLIALRRRRLVSSWGSSKAERRR